MILICQNVGGRDNIPFLVKNLFILTSSSVHTDCSVRIHSQNFMLYVPDSSQMSLSMEGT